NPFDDARFYIYNVMSSEGEVIFQSKPFSIGEHQNLIDEIKSRVSQVRRLLVLVSYDDQSLLVNLSTELPAANREVMIVTVFKGEDMRIFSTYRPIVTGAARRRRSGTASYPIEAYEYVPQGVILRTSAKDYHIVPTSSTKLATYYRGCPTTVRLRIHENTGKVN